MRLLVDKIKEYSQWVLDDTKRSFVALSGVVAVIVAVFVLSVTLAPRDFPVGRIVTITEGATLTEISELFNEKSVVASPFFFKMLVKVSSNDKEILAGDYFFEKPLTAFSVAQKVSNGEYGLEPKRVMIPEGATVLDIAAIFAANFAEFDSLRFLELVEDKEGYLFPDTYFFLPNVREEQVIRELMETFEVRVASIGDTIESSGRSFEDIVIMASIIEKEAWKEDDRRLISGVLWNRIDIGMPLQVDATFLYINGKNTYDLTHDDLDIDSPYNTYKYLGLTPGPICNPGLNSIETAAAPEESSYLFYLADRSGNTYFSLDFEEHKRYKWLYLD
ncbi:MAG: endolytic transglycosylase MltG [Candidatus Pacebacteria bacterium]|nr:endolytic transglycosylase MltG [Candidatus Paceibacterota bacterium]